MRSTSLGYLLFLLLFGGVPANAEQIEFKTSWIVSMPLTGLNGPLPRPREATKIERKDFVMAARLVPQEIGKLSSSVLDDDGDEIAPAGAELYALEASSGAIFCLSGMVSGQTKGKSLRRLRHDKPTCFIDDDKDGIFDYSFSARNLYRGLPNFSGRTPKKPKPVSGGNYTVFQARKMLANYYVALEYRGNENLSEDHQFRVVFGSAKAREFITSRILISKGDIPARSSLLGGEFEVLAGGKNQLNIKVLRPIQNVPFGVTRTVRYGI